MSKNRNSNKEPKKQPAMTKKEKRAMRKAKSSEKGLLADSKAIRGPIAGPNTKHS